ncbi:adenosine kinase [Alphaproteobacteria bacterium LSUCC0684]
MSSSPPIVTIGNAIVDIIALADDQFIIDQGMQKSAMNLIDAERASSLYDAIGPATEISGGSAANTAVGIVACGGQAGFIGKISEDMLGRIFSHDIQAAGVMFTPVYAEGNQTASSTILVTPDTERTMNTHLGASITLGPDDMDEDLIAGAEWVYLEGYLFDAPAGPDCYARVAEIARASRTKVAVSLSDAWCVERHHTALSAFLAEHTSLVFGNEDEILTLFPGPFDAAIRQVTAMVEEAVITCGAAGSLVVRGDSQARVAADTNLRVVDTTGAGDLYAGGYLFARQKGHDLETSARIATIAASEVISHIGARPQEDLSQLIAALDI